MKNKHFGSWQGILADVAIAIVIILLSEVGVLGIAVKGTKTALVQGIYTKFSFFFKVNTGELAGKQYEIFAFHPTYIYRILVKLTINFRLYLQDIMIRIIRNKKTNFGIFLWHKIAHQTQLLQILNKYNKMSVSNSNVIDFWFDPKFAKIVEDKKIAEQITKTPVCIAQANKPILVRAR